MDLARQRFSQAALLERAMKTQLTKQASLPGKGSPPGEWPAIFPILETGWNNTYAMGTHEAHVPEPGCWRTWQGWGPLCSGKFCCLPRVDSPWVADSGSQSWLCGGCREGCLGLEPLTWRSWGQAEGGGSPCTATSMVEQAEDSGQVGSAAVSPLQWVE